jgi:hypothetical protein
LNIILVLIFVFSIIIGLSFYLGRLLEGLRWSEKAYLNGRRIFFKGKQYKVIELPLNPDERDF